MTISSEVLVVISTAVSGILGLLGGMKMRKAQVKTNELDNVEQAIEIWRNLAADLNKEIEAMKLDNRALTLKVSELMRKVAELSKKNEEQSNEIINLRNQIKN